jgi:plasmid stabilization system protein ParE
MKYKVIFSKTAEKQIEDIAFYIGLDSLSMAKKFTIKMRSFFFDRLSTIPLASPRVKGEVRMLPYKKYGILYIVDESQMLVKVLYIFRGNQDWNDWINT